VVTEKSGRHVTDLTVEDFEVVHSGKKQPLQQALYVRTVSSRLASAAPRWENRRRPHT
jgi:hypothetical protein